MNPHYLITLGIEEFVPETGRVTDVLYDAERETITIEYEDAQEPSPCPPA